MPFPLPVAVLAAAILAGPGALGLRDGAPAADVRAALRVNLGGPALVDAQGRHWLDDGLLGARGQTSRTNGPVRSATPEVDATERYGNLQLRVPVTTSGRYVLRLHLTEIYWHQPGRRSFDVTVAGLPIAVGIDLLATGAEGQTQLLDVPVAAGTDGVDVALTPDQDNASLTGLELLPADSAGTILPDRPAALPSAAGALPPSPASQPSVTTSADPGRVRPDGAAGAPAPERSSAALGSSPAVESPSPERSPAAEVPQRTPADGAADRNSDSTQVLGGATLDAVPVDQIPAIAPAGTAVTESVPTPDRSRSSSSDPTFDGESAAGDAPLDGDGLPSALSGQTVPSVGAQVPGEAPIPTDASQVPASSALPIAPAPQPGAVAVPGPGATPAADSAVAPSAPSSDLGRGTGPGSGTGQQPLSPSTTSPLPAPPPQPAVDSTVVSVHSFGAVGDGRTDDTAALQRAFDQAPSGATLQLPAGAVFLHSDVLHLRRAGLHVTGPGELRAIREARSSIWIEADDVTLDGGLRLTMSGTTKRWDAWEQMRIRVMPVRGTVLRQISIDGSAAAGIYLGGASNFTLDQVSVAHTRADGIHMTGGSHDGQVLSPTVTDTGDDGVAVVSYGQDGAAVHDITVRSPTVLGTNGGRGISVVGGERITYTDIDVERSSAAAVYIASEGAPWFSAAPRQILVAGGTIRGANTDKGIDHGAVLVLAGDEHPPQDVVIRDLDISGTRASASRSVGVVTYGTPPRGVILDRLRITGGPASYYQGNTTSGYLTSGWAVDGRAVPDQTR